MNDICGCIVHGGDNTKCTNECKDRCGEEMFEEKKIIQNIPKN
ncbi:hypothetical protein LCGC14_0742270 [marine sediment metagenome]|uniref:Uncharacterized protein n=1 Tax=marine sediment metagenome TaxID=412755 RepID=A0A0F9QAI4_9ZZZZ